MNPATFVNWDKTQVKEEFCFFTELASSILVALSIQGAYEIENHTFL